MSLSKTPNDCNSVWGYGNSIWAKSRSVYFCNYLIINIFILKIVTKMFGGFRYFSYFVLVNEKVTDISEALLTMTEEMRLMRETIDSQHAEICNLNRNTEALHQEIRNLKEENKTLRDKLAKYEGPEKNSGNSSTPPSKENMKDEAIRRTKTLRKPTGRRPRGHKGHEGGTLKMTQTPHRPSTSPCFSTGAAVPQRNWRAASAAHWKGWSLSPTAIVPISCSTS